MKKTILMLTLALLCLASTAFAAVDIPYYEGYPVCVDGNWWIEVPYAYDAMDMTADYPCLYLMSEKMDVAVAVKIPEGYRHKWLSQSADVSGFQTDGAKVLSGVDATEASTVIERYTIDDLPAVRVDMTGQGYEMIWIGDGGDMYFFMYPLADEAFAQDMREVAATTHLISANTPVVTEASAFEYTVDGQGVTITRYRGENTRVAVPAEIDGQPVVALADGAFYETHVTWVSVPDNVQTIGRYCFSGCTFLQTLHLPQGLKALESGLLESCFRLYTLDVPDSVKTIGTSVFWGNFYLSEVKLPKSLETIGEHNFVMAENLERFILPEGNAHFATQDDGAVLFSADGKRLIRYCPWQNRSSYTVPDGVEVIESFAFADHGALKTIVVPEGVTTIRMAAFIHATALQELHLPSSAVDLGRGPDDGTGQICGNTTIIAPQGSAAQQYAEQFNLAFEAAQTAENTTTVE